MPENEQNDSRQDHGRNQDDHSPGAEKPASTKPSVPVSGTLLSGVDVVVRSRLAMWFAGFGGLLILVALVIALLKVDLPVRVVGIFICLGLAIIFSGFLGANATAKVLGVSFTGSAGVFAGLYYVFFVNQANADCPFYSVCKSSTLALQFLQPEAGKRGHLSADVMECLAIQHSGGKLAPLVMLEPQQVRDSDSEANNQFFLLAGDVAEFQIVPNKKPNSQLQCDGVMEAISLTDSEGIRVHRFWRSSANEHRTYAVTSVRGRREQGAAKVYQDHDLVFVKVYFAAAP
jgi:hypothetical protein